MWCKSHRNLVDSLYLPWNLWLDEFSTSQKPHWVCFMCLLTEVELLTFFSHRKLGSSVPTASGWALCAVILRFPRKNSTYQWPLSLKCGTAAAKGLLPESQHLAWNSAAGGCHSCIGQQPAWGGPMASFGQHTTNVRPWEHYILGENIYLWEYFQCHWWDSNRRGSLHLFQFSPAGVLIHAEEQISVSPWGWQISWSPLQRRSMYVNFGPDPTWGIFFFTV